MIEVSNLTKRFGAITAVKELNFSVGRGEVVGFLGPNGAGKTTTMRVLSSFLVPDEGTAKVADFDVQKEPMEARRALGYLPEGAPLYRDVSVKEHLELGARMRSFKGSEAKKAVSKTAEACGLQDVPGRVVGELSKGYRQRVGLAMALLHDPQVLLLDEPTSGLDPNQVAETRELIKAVGEQRTVLLSTHILREVEAVCSRIIILNKGTIAAEGTKEELAQQSGNLLVHVTFASEIEGVEKELRQLAAAAAVRQIDRKTYEIEAKKGDDPGQAVMELAMSKKWALKEVSHQEPGLEELFRQITKG